MPIASMTGFARAAGTHSGRGWTWEVRSVNARGLDVRMRLAPGADALEGPARAAVAARLKRGSVTVTLQPALAGQPQRHRINTEMIGRLLELTKRFKGKVAAGKPRLDALMAVRGVVEPVEEEDSEAEREARLAAMLKSLDGAIADLAAARAAEGERLEAMLQERLGEIEALTGKAGAAAAAQPEAIKARLKARVAELMEAQPALPEERLLQEAALVASRADVREELDRLSAHVAAARELLKRGGAIGRQFDFLAQEFNREANTLCSKSADMELTRIGLDLKTAIEQMREQAQNVE
ncbi:MAG: YicC/YloC family endoribonuclease [Rhodospirillales bacterium]